MVASAGDSHSFVVRIWVEETPEEGSAVIWRGHVTHVPDGERHYFECLTEMVSYMAPYLEMMGVRLPARWAFLAAAWRGLRHGAR